MSDLHLKDIKDDLTHEPPWVYLYAVLLIGIIAFALLSAGFMGSAVIRKLPPGQEDWPEPCPNGFGTGLSLSIHKGPMPFSR